MRLHGTVRADEPLLVVALEEEATHLHVTELPVLVTGAGKVNAACAVAATLGGVSPRSVVNLGTAGALREALTGIHVIGRVLQHDLDDEALFTLTGLHFGAAIELDGAGPTLATGDAFIADTAARQRLSRAADLVDMEGYAVAAAARAADIPVMLVKIVSDSADEPAARSWRDSVDACAEELGVWVRENLL